jgi:fucose 4-O-acetylase-like acetyltransferase
VAVGHLWLAANRDRPTLARCFRATFLVGAALTAAVTVGRELWPSAIHYKTEVIRQMGPGIFFHRLGLIGMLAGIGFVGCNVVPARFSVLRQLGRTSLLIYWVHIELCYGSLVYSLRSRFEIPSALALVAALTALMLGLSVAKTRLWPSAAAWLLSFRRTRPA